MSQRRDALKGKHLHLHPFLQVLVEVLVLDRYYQAEVFNIGPGGHTWPDAQFSPAHGAFTIIPQKAKLRRFSA